MASRQNVFNIGNWLRFKDFTDSQSKSFLKVYHKCSVFGFPDIIVCLCSQASELSGQTAAPADSLMFPPFLFHHCRVSLLIH